jgi:hypothetical protein
MSVSMLTLELPEGLEYPGRMLRSKPAASSKDTRALLVANNCPNL